MRRRQFLVSGALLATASLAGCAHPEVVLDLQDATAEDIADEVSITVDPGTEEFPVVSSAVENASTTRSGRSDLFDPDDIVRLDDSFYAVSETRLGTSEVTVYDVIIDFEPENTTLEYGEIEYDDLPETDRERLSLIIAEEETIPRQEDEDVGVDYGTAGEIGNQSVLVPDQKYDILRHEGNLYRVSVDARSATETEYQYEVTEVAPDVESFAEGVREQYLFRLEGLSEDERKVVEEAIDGGYFEDTDAFRSVIDLIREYDGIEVAEFYGTWLLAFRADEYITYVEW